VASVVNELHYSDNYIRARLTPEWPVTGALIGMTSAAPVLDPLTPAFDILSAKESLMLHGFGFLSRGIAGM
jgi:hypothetical protein